MDISYCQVLQCKNNVPVHQIYRTEGRVSGGNATCKSQEIPTSETRCDSAVAVNASVWDRHSSSGAAKGDTPRRKDAAAQRDSDILAVGTFTHMLVLEFNADATPKWTLTHPAEEEFNLISHLSRFSLSRLCICQLVLFRQTTKTLLPLTLPGTSLCSPDNEIATLLTEFSGHYAVTGCATSREPHFYARQAIILLNSKFVPSYFFLCK